MHDEQEDDGFENCLAGVPKDKGNEDQLRAYKEEELGSGYSEYKKPDDAYNDGSDEVHHMVKLVHSRLGIVQSQGKSSSTPKSVYLEMSWDYLCYYVKNEELLSGCPALTTQSFKDFLLILLVSRAPSKRLIAFKASSSLINRIKSP